jgi:bifunctional polynucleotide phosphatase/kinase
MEYSIDPKQCFRFGCATPHEGKKTRPCAGFDLDHTLIRPKSGRKFPKDCDDWMFQYPNTCQRLIQLSRHFDIVIFTNQNGLKKEPKKIEFVRKLKQFIDALDIPVQIYVSIRDGLFRKPSTGMWDAYLEGEAPKSLSFYCGDAAGREEDFAATDLMFAYNCNIAFKTPEQVFCNDKTPTICTWLYDHRHYVGAAPHVSVSTQEKVLLLTCGYPGSGKTFLASTVGLPMVSNDSCGSKSKCFVAADKVLNSGASLVVDNTFIDSSSRAEYVSLGRKYGCKVIIMHVDNNIDFCYYLNQVRCQLSKGVENIVPKIAYYALRKRFEPPAQTECDELVTITNRIHDLEYMFPGI